MNDDDEHLAQVAFRAVDNARPIQASNQQFQSQSLSDRPPAYLICAGMGTIRVDLCCLAPFRKGGFAHLREMNGSGNPIEARSLPA